MPGEYILNAIEPGVQGPVPYVVEKLFMTGQRPDTGHSAALGRRLGRTLYVLYDEKTGGIFCAPCATRRPPRICCRKCSYGCVEKLSEEKRVVLHMVYEVEMEVMSRDRRKKPPEPSSNV